MDVAGKFGDNLARCRRVAGMSQDELSIRASVHRTEISQLERGLRLARVDTREALRQPRSRPRGTAGRDQLAARKHQTRQIQRDARSQPVRCIRQASSSPGRDTEPDALTRVR
jgi:DNA-binding XRE family transcriptional regulator